MKTELRVERTPEALVEIRAREKSQGDTGDKSTDRVARILKTLNSQPSTLN